MLDGDDRAGWDQKGVSASAFVFGDLKCMSCDQGIQLLDVERGKRRNQDPA